MKKYNFLISFIIVILLVLDFLFVLFFHTNPLFALQMQTKDSKVYIGLGYKAFVCITSDFQTEQLKIASLFAKNTCVPMLDNEGKKFLILNKEKNSSTPMELFYQDPYYWYYFPYEQSENIFLRFSNNEIIKVKDALYQEKVTIDELLFENLNILKVPKFTLKIISKNVDSSLCIPNLLMEYGLSHIYSYCTENIYLNLNNQLYLLEEVLKEGKLDVEDIVYATNYGYYYGDGTREILKSDGPVMFRNKEYSLLKCSIRAGNDYYIGDSRLKYKDSFCQ